MASRVSIACRSGFSVCFVHMDSGAIARPSTAVRRRRLRRLLTVVEWTRVTPSNSVSSTRGEQASNRTSLMPSPAAVTTDSLSQALPATAAPPPPPPQQQLATVRFRSDQSRRRLSHCGSGSALHRTMNKPLCGVYLISRISPTRKR